MDSVIKVKCDKPRCGKLFSAERALFDDKRATCPVCNRSDFVYMVNEDGRLIHPTEKCPTCGKPALLLERCRCTFYCIKCSDGHEWYRCPEHKALVVGNPHEEGKHYGKCACPQDTKVIA
jgi:hypothetical protein